MYKLIDYIILFSLPFFLQSISINFFPLHRSSFQPIVSLCAPVIPVIAPKQVAIGFHLETTSNPIHPRCLACTRDISSLGFTYWIAVSIFFPITLILHTLLTREKFAYSYSGKTSHQGIPTHVHSPHLLLQNQR